MPTLWKPQQVNADVGQPAAVHRDELVWHPTEFDRIWFASFEADGGVQSHPVTMLTRFEPGGSFPLHGHPGGEEILVLEGVFEDHTGSHPPGTFLLNPEGFEHRPFSRDGCITFVKLRQHGGPGRLRLAAHLDGPGWRPAGVPGVARLDLYHQDGFVERTWAERWAPRSIGRPTEVHDTIETFVYEGSWCDGGLTYPAGSWTRHTPGQLLAPSSPTGCTLYVKAYPAGAPRYLVDPGFRHPDGSRG